MWWSINTAWASPSRVGAAPKEFRFVVLLAAAIALSAFAPGAWAQSGALKFPPVVTAGAPLSVPASGSGNATLYLVGPNHALKQEITLGRNIEFPAEELSAAGRYLAIVCSDSCQSNEFFVSPGEAASVSFLVHPSRAPVAQNNAVSGVAFPFDRFKNLVLAPVKVDFRFTVNGADVLSRSAETQNGVAWFRTNSGTHAGAAQLVASVGSSSVRRVVQQVASDPCNLRIQARPNPKGVLVETDPVRDCSGNPVPDGTIVTFTATDSRGKTTVDAPIKQGVARAQLLASGSTSISVASGVVSGNEVKVMARQ